MDPHIFGGRVNGPPSPSPSPSPPTQPSSPSSPLPPPYSSLISSTQTLDIKKMFNLESGGTQPGAPGPNPHAPPQSGGSSGASNNSTNRRFLIKINSRPVNLGFFPEGCSLYEGLRDACIILAIIAIPLTLVIVYLVSSLKDFLNRNL